MASGAGGVPSSPSGSVAAADSEDSGANFSYTDSNPLKCYREMSVGVALNKVLEEMVAEGKLNKVFVERIWAHYDGQMAAHLRKVTPTLGLRVGSVRTVDERSAIFEMLLEDVEMTMSNTGFKDTIHIPSAKSVRFIAYPATAHLRNHFAFGNSTVFAGPSTKLRNSEPMDASSDEEEDKNKKATQVVQEKVII